MLFNLPKELWLYIGAYLPPADTVALAQTCRRANNALLGSELDVVAAQARLGFAGCVRRGLWRAALRVYDGAPVPEEFYSLPRDAHWFRLAAAVIQHDGDDPFYTMFLRCEFSEKERASVLELAALAAADDVKRILRMNVKNFPCLAARVLDLHPQLQHIIKTFHADFMKCSFIQVLVVLEKHGFFDRVHCPNFHHIAWDSAVCRAVRLCRDLSPRTRWLLTGGDETPLRPPAGRVITLDSYHDIQFTNILLTLDVSGKLTSTGFRVPDRTPHGTWHALGDGQIGFAPALDWHARGPV